MEEFQLIYGGGMIELNSHHFALFPKEIMHLGNDFLRVIKPLSHWFPTLAAC